MILLAGSDGNKYKWSQWSPNPPAAARPMAACCCCHRCWCGGRWMCAGLGPQWRGAGVVLESISQSCVPTAPVYPPRVYRNQTQHSHVQILKHTLASVHYTYSTLYQSSTPFTPPPKSARSLTAASLAPVPPPGYPLPLLRSPRRPRPPPAAVHCRPAASPCFGSWPLPIAQLRSISPCKGGPLSAARNSRRVG